MFPSFLKDKNMLKFCNNHAVLETSDFNGASDLILRGKLFPISQEFPCFLFHDWAVNLLFKTLSTKGR